MGLVRNLVGTVLIVTVACPVGVRDVASAVGGNTCFRLFLFMRDGIGSHIDLDGMVSAHEDTLGTEIDRRSEIRKLALLFGRHDVTIVTLDKRRRENGTRFREERIVG